MMIAHTYKKFFHMTTLFVILVLMLSACQPKNPDSALPSATNTTQKTATRTPTKIPTSTPTHTPPPTWLVPLTELEETELLFTHQM